MHSCASTTAPAVTVLYYIVLVLHALPILLTRKIPVPPADCCCSTPLPLLRSLQQIPCQMTQMSGVTVERGPDCYYVQVKCRDRKGLLSDIINALRQLPLEVRPLAAGCRTPRLGGECWARCDVVCPSCGWHAMPYYLMARQCQSSSQPLSSSLRCGSSTVVTCFVGVVVVVRRCPVLPLRSTRSHRSLRFIPTPCRPQPPNRHQIRTAAVTTTNGTVRDVFEVKLDDPGLSPEDVQNLVHDALFQSHLLAAQSESLAAAGKRPRA